jgi:hypothetical protein
MARGGYGGRGVPLHARTRTNDPTSGRPAKPPAATPCPVKHCWVTVPVDGGAPRPGLLLEWRKDVGGRWEGRVVYAAELRPGRWATVEEWVGEGVLDPLQEG